MAAKRTKENLDDVLLGLFSSESESEPEQEKEADHDDVFRGACLSPEIALQDKSTPATSDSVSTDETDDNGLARDPDVTIKRPRTRLGMSGDHDGASDSDLEADGLEGSEIMSLLRTICDTVKKNTRCLKQLQEAQATAQRSRYSDVNNLFLVKRVVST